MGSEHHLPARPDMVHWGAFDPDFAPVLTVRPGDTIDIETLSGEPEDLPPPEFQHRLLPEHLEVHRHTPRGPGPHFMTGPIYVQGAAP